MKNPRVLRGELSCCRKESCDNRKRIISKALKKEFSRSLRHQKCDDEE